MVPKVYQGYHTIVYSKIDSREVCLGLRWSRFVHFSHTPILNQIHIFDQIHIFNQIHFRLKLTFFFKFTGKDWDTELTDFLKGLHSGCSLKNGFLFHATHNKALGYLLNFDQGKRNTLFYFLLIKNVDYILLMR